MVARISHYCQHGLWDVDLQELKGIHRFGVSLLRLILVAAWEFRDSGLSIRATSLVYTTLLSMVPFLAVTFSVLKAFGIHQQIEPVLAQGLEPLGEKGVEITQSIIGFVDNLKVGVLGAVGVAGLFYTTYSLIDKIEDAMNSIWRLQQGRPLARKFTDYLSVVLMGPVLVFTAFGLTASAQSHWLIQRILEIQPLGYLVVLATKFLPYIFIGLLFTFLYKFVPYTKVRLRSALVGGITAGVLWQGAGIAFAAFVASSGKYSAVYSSFAVLILFLIWLDVGWLIVLVGAQVAYYHQHPSAYLSRLRWCQNSHVFRERLILSMLRHMTSRYVAEQPPVREEELARLFKVPLSVVEDLIKELIPTRLVVRTSEPEGLTLGRPPEQVTVLEVLGIIRQGFPYQKNLGEDDAVSTILQKRDRAVQSALDGETLRTFAS